MSTLNMKKTLFFIKGRDNLFITINIKVDISSTHMICSLL